MPHAHVDSVIQALAEPWFYGNERSAGTNYGKLLLEQFGKRADKDAIESGLALGGYLIHTEANKRQRLALRAAMLAFVLMRKEPATSLPTAKKRFESLNLEKLKRAFINQFPILTGMATRHSWAPSMFTNPKFRPKLEVLRSWETEAVPRYSFIVHTNEFPERPSPVFADPLAELCQYSASSFSLLTHEKPFTYFKQGIIFRVPQNNYLVTYHSDLMSTLRERSMHEGTFSKHTFAEEITELSMAAGSGSLLSPSAVVRMQNTNKDSVGVKSPYNELLICAKAGAPLPHGITGALQVTGIFMMVHKNGKIDGPPYNAEERHSACKGHAKRLGVPLLYLPNAA